MEHRESRKGLTRPDGVPARSEIPRRKTLSVLFTYNVSMHAAPRHLESKVYRVKADATALYARWRCGDRCYAMTTYIERSTDKRMCTTRSEERHIPLSIVFFLLPVSRWRDP